jgi:predicted amidohydrolase
VKELTVSALQMHISHSAAKNIEKFRSMAEKMDGTSDIFLLPELWTGMCNAEESEAALEAVCAVCRDLGAYAVAGTVPWPCGNGFTNRAWVVNDAGTPFAHYDKAHLFSLGGEDKIFTAGDKPLIFSFRGLDCSVLVSYDIMFPEYSRCAGLAGAKIVFVPARQPLEWHGSWEMLVRSSAASSQAYVVVCNAAGTEGLYQFEIKGLKGEALKPVWTIAQPHHKQPIDSELVLNPATSFGLSLAVSPQGGVVESLGEREGILTSRLDISEIFKCRKRLPLTEDRRPELYGMITG